MRTLQLKKFKSNLSELNSCYSHYIFTWEQFNLDHNSSIKAHKNKLTTDIFPGNTKAMQHNVLLSHLQKSHIETQNVILKSIYLIGYSYFEDYLIQLHQLGQKIDDNILDIQQKVQDLENEDDTLLNKLINRLGRDFENKFAEAENNTLDYIRVRRNRIVHGSPKVQGKLLAIAKKHGKRVNEYWNMHLKSGLYNLDFSEEKMDNFETLDLYDVFSILRKISAKIDSAFIECIGRSKFQNYILQQFLLSNGQDVQGLNDKRKRFKFKRYCLTEYAYAISDSELYSVNITAV